MTLTDLQQTQNFIVNSNLIKDLIKNSSLNINDLVIEIGPGTGVITKELSDTVKEVIAIEKDPVLFKNLESKFSTIKNVKFVHSDFLYTDMPKEEYKIFSNIPFNITSSIIKRITESYPFPKDVYLFVQKEAAERYIGIPTETMQSLLLKPWFQLNIQYEFKRSDFGPTPNVDIVLLEIQPYEIPLIKNKEIYKDFIAYCFLQYKPSLKLATKKIFTHLQFKILSHNLNFPIESKHTDLNFIQWKGLFEFFISTAKVNNIKGSYDKYSNNNKKIIKINRTRKFKDWKKK